MRLRAECKTRGQLELALENLRRFAAEPPAISRDGEDPKVFTFICRSILGYAYGVTRLDVPSDLRRRRQRAAFVLHYAGADGGCGRQGKGGPRRGARRNGLPGKGHGREDPRGGGV